MTVNLLGAAIFQASEGIAVFPCSSRTKQPLTAHGFIDATCDIEQIKEWWAKYPDAIIGSPTGKKTNRVIVDTDSDRGEQELMLLAEQAGAVWPETYTVKTGHGKHFYFNYPGKAEIGNSARRLPDNVDIRGEGGYVILPPSPHPAGGFYEIINHVPKADLPGWLLTLLVNWGPDKVIEIREATPSWAMRQYCRAIAELKRAKDGNRNKRLNDAAWWASRLSGHPLLAEKITSQEIVQIAERLGLGYREIEATCQSGWRGGQEKKIKILAVEECTDLGNADRFCLKHGNTVRYVPAFGEKGGWHIWNGHRWEPDSRRRVRKLAQETVRAIHVEAAGVEDDEIRKRLGKWALQSESAKVISAMLECISYQAWLKGRSMTKKDPVGGRAIKDQLVKKGYVVSFDPEGRRDIVLGLMLRHWLEGM
jgi:putative DNA primase/helicase